MATLTVTDDRLRQVDEFAKEKALSREDVVDEAIRIYLGGKRAEEMNEWRRNYAARRGVITEEEIAEEIRAYRNERKRVTS